MRKSKDLTQIELASMAGLSVPTIRLLENGYGNLVSWNRVLKALDLEIVGRSLPPGESLGTQLATLRRRRGFSQRELAELIGTTQPTIVALERNERGRLRTLDAALTALGGVVYLAPKGSEKDFYTHAGNSSTHHGWQSPGWLMERLYKVFGTFDLDPCSPSRNRRSAPVQARYYYTMEDDALSLPWFGKVFVNPPYGREIHRWIAKARKELTQGNAACVVALLPARTDTGYWHKYVAGSASVFFLKGRLRFNDGEQAAPFPSAVVVWGAGPEETSRLEEALPEAWALK